MAETALVVLVPELEPLLDAWRRTLTPDGARAMPPHVTLLYPFADDRDAGALLETVTRTLAPFAPFDVSFATLARFPDTLYLAPEPAAPWVALTEALSAAFPAYPRYGGAHDEVIPHLTVASGDEARFAPIERELPAFLPISLRVERVWLMVDSPDGWRRCKPFALKRR
jgi:2'-5' RNA ligase